MRKELVSLLIVALTLRLLLAFASPGASYDIESYRIQGQAVLDRQNIYAVTWRYPYPPLWMYVPASALILERWTGFPFHFWVKLPAILADIGIGWLLFCWPQTGSACSSSARGIGYLMNPVALLITAAHGQFDSIVIFFVLVATRLLVGGPTWVKKIGSALGLGVAIALKGFPVLLLPVYMLSFPSWVQGVLYAVLASSVLGVLVLPYLSASGARILNIILAYSSVPDHSYGYLLNQTAVARPLLNLIRSISRWLQVSAAALATVYSVICGYTLETRVTLALLTIYVVSPGMASQQLLWVLPFLILVQRRSLGIYTLLSTVSLVLFYGQYFPAVIMLSAPWSGKTLAVGRLAIASGWWLSIVGILLTIVSKPSAIPAGATTAPLTT